MCHVVLCVCAVKVITVTTTRREVMYVLRVTSKLWYDKEYQIELSDYWFDDVYTLVNYTLDVLDLPDEVRRLWDTNPGEVVRYVKNTYDIVWIDDGCTFVEDDTLWCVPLQASSLEEAIEEAKRVPRPVDVSHRMLGSIKHLMEVDDFIHIFQCDDVEPIDFNRPFLRA